MAILLAGCARVPTGNSGGVATIGKAVLSPFKAIGEAISPVAPHVKPDAPKARESAPLSLPENEGMTLTQPDNPASPSQQNLEIERTEEITLSRDSVKVGADGSKTEIPAGSTVKLTEKRKAGQVIGASRPNTAAETTAWLASFRGIQFVGVVVFLAGVVGFMHPVLRALIGGKDVGVSLGLAGLVMMFGPAIAQKIPWWAWLLSLLAVALLWRYRRAALHEAEADILKTGHNKVMPD